MATDVNELDLELQLMAAVEPLAGSAEDTTAGAIRDFLPLIQKLFEKARELISKNPEQIDLIIKLTLDVYDKIIAQIPTGLPLIFDQMIKSQVRQGLEAVLRQLLAGA